MTKYDKYKNLLSEMNQLAPAKSGTQVQPYSDAHTAWLVGTLPEQVMAFYGVKYREEAVPPSDISPNWTLRIECHTCTNWVVSIQNTNAVYAALVEEGESRMVWPALWKTFHEHLHVVHSPSGDCKCSALINHMAPHKEPAWLWELDKL